MGGSGATWSRTPGRKTSPPFAPESTAVWIVAPLERAISFRMAVTDFHSGYPSKPPPLRDLSRTGCARSTPLASLLR